MRLIFLRHATAVPKDPAQTELDDFNRELTRGGYKELKYLFRKNKDLLKGIDVIYSSPLVRALSTAETLYRKWNSKKFEILPSLDSHVDPSVFLEELESLQEEGNVLCFVGHEPHLTTSVKAILGCEDLNITLAKGGIIVLEGDRLSDLSLTKLVSP